MKSKSYTIEPYIGFTDTKGSVIRGRVLNNPAIFSRFSDSRWRNLINMIKRFNTNKVRHQEIRLSINSNEYSTITNDEGYFLFEVEDSLINDPHDIATASLDINEGEKVLAKMVKIDSDYIVISDIDDTIIKTQVSSRFKLKLLYNTIFRNQYQRTAITGMPEVYQHLEEIHLANFFYISKSPHNLYTYILDFLKLNKYPVGSIMLRDFGWHLLRKKSSFSEKYNELVKLFDRFSNKKFILVGDGAEKDADIYSALANKFPKQTKAIFIRNIGCPDNLKRIQDDVLHQSKTPLLIFDDSDSLKEQLKNIVTDY